MGQVFINLSLAAINTLNASWITLYLARRFGQKSEVFEFGKLYLVAYWGKKYYMLSNEGNNK